MVVPKRKGPRRDDGYFGPGSVTWEIFGHPAAFGIGQIRSGLYGVLGSEVAHAVRGTGVAVKDPSTRALESLYWAYTSVFGDTAEARRAGKFVQGRHAPVKGHDPVSHTDYTPMRPDLAIAGHCLIWESPLIAYETFVGPLTEGERERYWSEGLVAAELIGIDLAIIPPTWSDWLRYRDEQITPILNYSIAGQAIQRSTHEAAYAPAWARPGLRGLLWLTSELALITMPPAERALLGGSTGLVRVAAARAMGRGMAIVADVPVVRDVIERGYGGAGHQMMAEARAISRRRGGTRPTGLRASLPRLRAVVGQ